MNRICNCKGQGPLADILFCLDEEQFGSAICGQARKEFDILVYTLQAKRLKKRRFSSQIAFINHLLFRKQEFKYIYKVRDEAITFSTTLQNKQGVCLGLTSVYFALADALSVPIRPLLHEGHITVCHIGFDPQQHIEVSLKGALLSERMAAKRYHAKGEGPLVLTREQFVAVYLSNQAAFVLAKHGNLRKALETLDLAIELFPTYSGAWINRASILLKVGNRKRARCSIEHALNLNLSRKFRRTAQLLYKMVS